LSSDQNSELKVALKGLSIFDLYSLFFSNRIFIVVYSLLESLQKKQLGSSSPPVQTVGQVFLFTAHLLDFFLSWCPFLRRVQ